jgi:hypothetical protein
MGSNIRSIFGLFSIKILGNISKSHTLEFITYFYYTLFSNVNVTYDSNLGYYSGGSVVITFLFNGGSNNGLLLLLNFYF